MAEFTELWWHGADPVNCGIEKLLCDIGLLLYAMFYMHPRNRKILGPMMRAYGNKDREQSEKSRPIENPRRDQSPRLPRQLSLLDK